MSKTRPKPYWWQWKTSESPWNKNSRRIHRKGQRRVRDRETQREIKEQS